MPNAKTRRCPFYECHQMIDPELFACRRHWPTMGDDERMEIWAAYSAFLKGEIRIEELVERQALVMLKTTPEIVPGHKQGAGPQAIELGKAIEQYIRLRKEYTATKDGYVEAKKRIGIALGKQETVVANLAKAILHPEQKQPTLFDGGKEESNQLPD